MYSIYYTLYSIDNTLGGWTVQLYVHCNVLYAVPEIEASEQSCMIPGEAHPLVELHENQLVSEAGNN